MIDKNLRNLERFQDSLKLKLLQRRLGQGVYIQEAPRPIKVFNEIELLIDISKEEYRDGSEYGSGEGSGHGFENGSGCGWGWGVGAGYIGKNKGSGGGRGHGEGYKSGWGTGSGLGWGSGSKSGEPEDYYTRDLREKHG